MNLFDLIIVMGHWCSKQLHRTGAFIGRCIRVSVRMWYVTLLCIALGAGAGCYHSRTENHEYKVDAVLLLNGPTTDMIKTQFKQLENSNIAINVPSQNTCNLLGLDPEEDWKICKFACYDVIDCLADSIADYVDYKRKNNHLDTVSVVMRNRIAIRFCTKRLELVPQVEESIVRFFNDNPQNIARYEFYKHSLDIQNDFMEKELARMDTVARSFYLEQGVTNIAQFDHWSTNMLIGRRELVLLDEDILEIFEKKTELDKKRATCTAPIVLEGHFTANLRPINWPLKEIPLGIFIGYMLAVLIGTCIEQRKKILAWLKQ